jgi:hypothetical protein
MLHGCGGSAILSERKREGRRGERKREGGREGSRGDEPERLEDEAEMTAVFERAEQPDDVLLVVRVGVPQLAQDLRLFQPGFVPVPFEQGGGRASVLGFSFLCNK